MINFETVTTLEIISTIIVCIALYVAVEMIIERNKKKPF